MFPTHRALFLGYALYSGRCFKAGTPSKTAMGKSKKKKRRKRSRSPELVHEDPYGAGWLARLELTRFEEDRAALLTGEPVAAAMAHHAWLNREE